MTTQITIIGLGQIGSSIGLALAKYPENIQRVGYDRVLETQNKARDMGAVDSVKFNLSSAIEGAGVVLLCIPLDQLEETFKNISADLREDAVVLDFSPQKVLAHRWFTEHVPTGRHYIGMVPSINPLCLDLAGHGIDSARADLFEGATVGVAAPAGAASQAMKLAADLVSLLGAQTIFLDMLEADGMEMTAHILPQVFSAAMLNATVGQPGWSEARRFAGRPYHQSTGAIGSDTLEALADTLLNNPISAKSVLDNAIGALTHLRAAVENGDKDDLKRRLELALADREKWLEERRRAEWVPRADTPETPKGGDIFKRIFLGDRSQGKKK